MIKEDKNEETQDETAKEILKEALELFKLSCESEQENRDLFLEDIKFARLGDQWPEGIKTQREQENRPCLTYNKLPAFLRQVVNDARQNKPAIRTHPVDSGSDVETSEVLNGLIRNIEQSSNADVAYDTAMDSAVGGGIGYIRVNIDYADDDTFDLDIKIERVSNPLTVHGDHRSTAADSSDWNYCFVEETIPEDDFKERYPDAMDSSFEVDSDNNEGWFDEKSVRIAEFWQREEITKTIYLMSNGMTLDEDSYSQIAEDLAAGGIQVQDQREVKSHKITQRIMSGAEILETNKWPGKYIPLIPVYGDEIWVEGKRHWQSLIRHAKDAQRSFNYWHTSAAEKVALDTKAPWIGKKGSFASDPNWNTANTKNHAKLEYDGQQAPFRTPAGGVPASDLAMAMQASDHMKSIIGIHDASLGAQGNETSGRAIMARQREGDVSTFHFIDNLSRAIRHTGRIIVDLIPHIYSTARIIRTLGEDGTPGMVQVNQEHEEKGIPKLYDLTTGKYDVTVSSGPSYNSKREEAADQMTELIRVYPNAAPMIADLLAKNLDWPGADDIAKRLRPPGLKDDEDDPQVIQLKQQIQQMQQQGQEIMQQGQQQMQQMQQEIQKLTAESQGLKADKSVDAEKLKVDAYNAETNRLKVTQVSMSPEQMQALIIQTITDILSTPDITPPDKPQQQPLGPSSEGFFSPNQQG